MINQHMHCVIHHHLLLPAGSYTSWQSMPKELPAAAAATPELKVRTSPFLLHQSHYSATGLCCSMPAATSLQPYLHVPAPAAMHPAPPTHPTTANHKHRHDFIHNIPSSARLRSPVRHRSPVRLVLSCPCCCSQA
jgi:hypothetical protein